MKEQREAKRITSLRRAIKVLEVKLKRTGHIEPFFIFPPRDNVSNYQRRNMDKMKMQHDKACTSLMELTRPKQEEEANPDLPF